MFNWSLLFIFVCSSNEKCFAKQKKFFKVPAVKLLVSHLKGRWRFPKIYSFSCRTCLSPEGGTKPAKDEQRWSMIWAVRAASLKENPNLSEWKPSCQLSSQHDHSSDPEKDEVAACFQQRIGVKVFQIRSLWEQKDVWWTDRFLCVG